MATIRRYRVAGSPDQPIGADTCGHGPHIDSIPPLPMREAEQKAEEFMDRGYRGVALTEYGSGAVVAIWEMCKTVVDGYRLPDGRITFPAWWCGRHDVLDDGRCPEHTQGGRPLPAGPEQLGLEVTC